jgi:CheY-like chemotaxis protein
VEVHAAGAHVPTNELNWAKTSFLVVDSKSHFRDMVQTALLGAGAKSVKHATSVEKAIESLTRYGQEINCVVCDWEMAPLGGIELLRMIRCRTLPKTHPRTAVVLLTTRADAQVVKAAMALDVNGIAVAPLSFEKLVKTVAHALTRTWMLHQASQYAAVPPIDVSQLAPPDPKPAAPKPPPIPDMTPSAARPVMGEAKAMPRRTDLPLKNVHMATLKEIRPGQVLAKDLRDKDGHLLLGAGAVLKPVLLDKLLNVAQGYADSYHLWIGERDGSED